MFIEANKQPIFIILSAIIGLIIGELNSVIEISTGYIEFFLILLLYVLFLSIDISKLNESLKNYKYTMVSVVINFIITPIIAYCLGIIFFIDSIEIRIGLLMLLVTPCTDWYLVFTKLSKGNVMLNLSILPLNLILQIVLMPLYLYLFLDSEIHIEVIDLAQSMIFVLFIPFICSLITNKCIKNKQKIKCFINEQNDHLQLLFMCLAVIVMFASNSNSLVENPMLLLKLFFPLLIFFTLLFVISQGIGRILKFNINDITALTFTTLARNSPLSLAIAISAFPNYPLTSLALVIGPLIELPILSIISSLLLKCNKD